MTGLLPNWDTDDVESLRRFAALRLVALDLDGTTVSQVDKSIFTTIRGLQNSLRQHRYGVEVTIATGRTLAGVRPLLDDWCLSRDSPLILYNGSVVVRNGTFQLIAARHIDEADLSRIIEICRSYKVQVLSYTYQRASERIFSQVSKDETVTGWSYGPQAAVDFNGMVIDWRDDWQSKGLCPPNAVLIDAANESVRLPRLRPLLEGLKSVTVTQSGPTFLELRPVGSNKGAALADASAARGVMPHQVLALGDNDNDVEMLEWAGIGVAVAGASVKAKCSSNFACRHGVSEAVVEVLRLIKHARRFFPHEKGRSERGSK